MIENKLDMLKSEYRKLSPTQQNLMESIISYLIDFIELGRLSEKTYLGDINKYLSNKLKREKKENRPSDIFQLRNLVIRNKPFKSEYDEKLEKLVWTMVPELTYFKNLENLSNFLGNYLLVDKEDDKNIHKKIDNKKLSTKMEVINEYRKLYERFPKPRQKKSLHEFARGIFVAARRNELAKFKELI